MADLKTLKKMVKALNKLDLMEDDIEFKGVDVDELQESFIQGIEEIDDNGKTDEVDDDILDYYEDLLEEIESAKKSKKKDKKKGKGKKGKGKKKGRKSKDKDEDEGEDEDEDEETSEFDEDALREELEDMDLEELEEYCDDNGVKVKIKDDDDEEDVVEKIVKKLKKAAKPKKEKKSKKKGKGKKEKKDKKKGKGKKGKKEKKSKKKKGGIESVIETALEDEATYSSLLETVADELDLDEKKAARQLAKAIVSMDLTFAAIE